MTDRAHTNHAMRPILGYDAATTVGSVGNNGDLSTAPQPALCPRCGERGTPDMTGMVASCSNCGHVWYLPEVA